MFKYWKKYRPEEELFIRLKDNPVWPFKPVGDGYYYVSFRSDRYDETLLNIFIFIQQKTLLNLNQIGFNMVLPYWY
jgi:hypothetical protein